MMAMASASISHGPTTVKRLLEEAVCDRLYSADGDAEVNLRSKFELKVLDEYI